MQRRVLDRVYWFVGGRLCFPLNGLGESGFGFWASLVSNNREGTEETTSDVVEGYEVFPVALGRIIQRV